MSDDNAELAELADTLRGLTPMTDRQVQVAAMIARGFTDQQIAGRMGIDDRTVRMHVVMLAARLGLPGGASTRVLVARWWWEHDLPDIKDAA